jgi:glycosyltransferase involved in cell wall biosynthesis
MKISVVIPTRGDQNMKNILACLQVQTFGDFEVIFVVDKTVTSDPEVSRAGE